MIRDFMRVIAAASASDAENMLRIIKRCAGHARDSADGEALKVLEQGALALDGAIGASRATLAAPESLDPCELCGKRIVDPECNICG